MLKYGRGLQGPEYSVTDVHKKRERTGSFHTSPICLFDNLIESHNVRDIFMAIFNQVFKNASKKQVSFVRQ